MSSDVDALCLPTTSASKSISTENFWLLLGVKEQYLSSTITSIFFRIFKNFLFALSDFIPQLSIISIKGNELPSIMGTSGPFNSTIILSIPIPLKAAIKCSIVDTLTPYSFSIVVHKLVSDTFL